MQGSFGRCRNGVLRDEFRHMPEEILLSEEVHESFSQGILPVDHNRCISIAF